MRVTSSKLGDRILLIPINDHKALGGLVFELLNPGNLYAI